MAWNASAKGVDVESYVGAFLNRLYNFLTNSESKLPRLVLEVYLL